jgi:hypothetical protein
VDDMEAYWTEPPPAPSARLRYWLARIAGGWRPNRRIRTAGYGGATHFFGVYLWEYLQVLSPLLYEEVAARQPEARAAQVAAWLRAPAEPALPSADASFALPPSPTGGVSLAPRAPAPVPPALGTFRVDVLLKGFELGPLRSLGNGWVS